MSKSKSSLGELMGSKASKGFSLKDLPDILGEAMPDLPKTRVGRFRLVRALRQRFGDNFRSLPGVSDVVKEFDDEVDFEGTISKMKNIGRK